MASGWKRVAERLAARSGLTRAIARRRTPSVAILAYHNVVPTGEAPAGDVSLHVDQRTFAEQLDFLTEWGDVVELAALDAGSADPAAAPAADAARPRLVVTFDDAYRGTMTAGLDELRARGLPATVFVPPGLLGEPAFWWDALAPRGGRPLAPQIRAHALGALQGRQARILDWAERERLPVGEMPEHARPVGEAELIESAVYEHVALGAHTWGHANLAAIGPDEAREEFQRSRSWLLECAPRYIDWLTYPYGLRTDETVALASDCYDGALLIDGGLARSRGASGHRHALPRINVPRGLTLEGLALRLAGLLA
jgi:peptidoglycan/xylan/chitin deacetylase (PgdA/CDA1 family)